MAPNPTVGTSDTHCHGMTPAAMAGLTSKSRSEYRNLFLWQDPEQGEEMEKKRERSLQVRDMGRAGQEGSSCQARAMQLVGGRAWFGTWGSWPSLGTEVKVAPRKGGNSEHRGSSCNPARAHTLVHALAHFHNSLPHI